MPARLTDSVVTGATSSKVNEVGGVLGAGETVTEEVGGTTSSHGKVVAILFSY